MLVFISCITIILALILIVFNRKTGTNVLFLGLFFILTALFGIAHYLVFQSQDVFWIALTFNHFVPLMFLIGPFLYFYVRGIIYHTSFRVQKDFLHFVPTVLSIAGTIPYYILPFDEKKNFASILIHDIDTIRNINVNLFYDAGESFVLRSVLSLCYSTYCLYLVFQFYKTHDLKNKQNQIIVKWLGTLLGSMLSIAIVFIILAFYAVQSKTSNTINKGYTFYIFTGIIYAIMSFSLLLFPELLYGETVISSVEFEPIKNKRKKRIQIVENSETEFIPDAVAIEWGEKIKWFLENKKPYLNPDFSITDLALEISLSESQTTFYIHKVLKSTFCKLRTELRIKNAIHLLETESNDIFTIEAIAEKSGFKTRSNFYNTFKAHMGESPKEYVKRIRG